jgi:hypothetical protein
MLANKGLSFTARNERCKYLLLTNKGVSICCKRKVLEITGRKQGNYYLLLESNGMWQFTEKCIYVMEYVANGLCNPHGIILHPPPPRTRIQCFTVNSDPWLPPNAHIVTTSKNRTPPRRTDRTSRTTDHRKHRAPEHEDRSVL